LNGAGPKTGREASNTQGSRDGEATERAPLRGRKDQRGRKENHGRVAELFEAHNQALLRFLTCRLNSAQEAKEVAQEAYVRLLQLDAPDARGYLRALLFKTAANLAADRLKSASRRRRIDRLEFFDGGAQLAPSPEQGISAAQEITVILDVLDELPARCRYAFLMHRFYGHSVAEVASLMNLSVRSVQLYVERALVFCRDRLHESS
jgi:RNA polymerase sigma factor (sigma-70 family)